METPSLLRIAPEAPPAVEPVFRVINRTVYFNGDCEQCRPHCGAVCCSGYGLVSLTEEEAQSGRYVYEEAGETCDCASCQQMKAAGVKYTLVKQPDGSCLYLDGTRRCSIYEDRPETCRNYRCTNVPFMLGPA